MIRSYSSKVGAGAAMALLAGCAAKAPPPPPPPPPPPIAVVIPPAPTPPDNASPNLVLPPADANGLRHSVNRNITPAQQVWNLRSAYNVAALNCNATEFGEIVINYRAFLKDNEKALASYNRKVDAEFKGKYGSSFIAPREKYMTEVYNHFALPPTLREFCKAVLAVSRDAIGIQSADLEAFATRSLPNVEVVFDDFYRRYEAYRVALNDWNAKYAPAPVITLPAPAPAVTVPAVLNPVPAQGAGSTAVSVTVPQAIGAGVVQ